MTPYEYDIVLQKEQHYEVCIMESVHHPVVLDMSAKDYTVCIIGLLTREDFYGDELKPIIMRLFENRVSLGFETALIPKDEINFTLQTSVNGMYVQIEASLDDNDIQLIQSTISVSSGSYLPDISNGFVLSSDAEIIGMAWIKGQRNETFRLNSYLNDIIRKTVYLYLPGSRLIDLDGKYLEDLDPFPLSVIGAVRISLTCPKIDTEIDIDLGDVSSDAGLVQGELEVFKSYAFDSDEFDMQLTIDADDIIKPIVKPKANSIVFLEGLNERIREYVYSSTEPSEMILDVKMWTDILKEIPIVVDESMSLSTSTSLYMLQRLNHYVDDSLTTMDPFSLIELDYV